MNGLVNKAIKESGKKLKEKFNSLEGSHDWFHIERVYQMSKHLQKHEGGNEEVIKLSALLHDISDHKYNGGDFDAGAKQAYQIIIENGGNSNTADKVARIVSQISFKGALVEEKTSELELKIVRDADRLDAIGAIGIARALYRNAEIIVLDEATSSLDSESEKLIQDALQELQKNRTTIVIAHRLSTIENADQIIVLDQGVIVEQGKHDTLIENDGIYSKLHNIQFSLSE